MSVEPSHCIDCGAAIRIKPKTPGTCPYCGVHIASGVDGFHAIEPLAEPPPVREYRRRHTRVFGALQFLIGAAGTAVFVSKGWPLATFAAGLLAAHGLYRLLFSSGPNRHDDDYEE